MSVGFDETDDRLVYADNAKFSLPAGDFTVSCWVYVPDNTGADHQYFLSHGDLFTNNSFNWWIREASQASEPSKFGILIQDNIGGSTNFNTTYDTDVGSWMHLLAIRESDTLYVIKNNTDTSSGDATGVGAIDPTADFHVGCRTDLDANRFFGGRIAELAKWSRALSAAERAALASGVTPLMLAGKPDFYMPFLRSQADVLDGGTPTATGTTYEDHPPVLYPASGQVFPGRPATDTVELAATLTLVTGGSAALSNAASMSGTLTLVTSGSAALAVSHSLSATMTLTTGGSARLEGTGTYGVRPDSLAPTSTYAAHGPVSVAPRAVPQRQ